MPPSWLNFAGVKEGNDRQVLPFSSMTVSQKWDTSHIAFPQALKHQFSSNSSRLPFEAGTTFATMKAENLFMRLMFYIRYYVVPPASFGIFVVAEGLFLYGLYRAFIAP